MQEVSITKRMKVIKLYLQGYSYKEIAKKVGVSKGTVANIVADLKAGEYPDVSTVPEEIEQLRDLATSIRRTNISPVQANIGLSVIERLDSLGIEPSEIEKLFNLMQAFSPTDKDLAAMAKSILTIEDVKETTGMTLKELEDKVIKLRQEAEKLTPLSEQIKTRRQELKELTGKHESLTYKVKDLRKQEAAISDYVNKLEAREVRLRNHTAELEERAYAADKQLIDARKDLKVLDKIGISVEELNRFTTKLKGISAYHDIKPQALGNRLLKDLKSLDKGLGLECVIEEKQAQLKEITDKIASKQAEKDKLHAYLK